MNNFKVGDLVVCIDDKIDFSRQFVLENITQWIVKGRVYKVRVCWYDGKDYGIGLEGIINKICFWSNREAGYLSKRFVKFQYKSLLKDKVKTIDDQMEKVELLLKHEKSKEKEICYQ